jgi:general secretion pathway protein G
MRFVGKRKSETRRARESDRHASLTTSRGWTLIELIITLTVLSILTLGVVPIVRTVVKRQKEERLREALREMRTAIDEFHRDTVGSPCPATATVVVGTPLPNTPPYIDPRSRVVISECTIFTADNPDRYPPELQTLVSGVSIIPRANLPPPGTVQTAPVVSTQRKVYLRQIPVDPMTGEAEWELRSSYDPADSTSWGRQNVFDVRSRSRDTALNGERYSDW